MVKRYIDDLTIMRKSYLKSYSTTTIDSLLILHDVPDGLTGLLRHALVNMILEMATGSGLGQ
jgi:hypothetical protein